MAKIMQPVLISGAGPAAEGAVSISGADGAAKASGGIPAGSDALPPDYPSLVASLAQYGQSVCENWDMVCSYNLADLNRLLNAAAGTEKVSVPFSGTGVDPEGGQNFTITGTAVLDQPQLQFLADGRCQVTMPISGGSYYYTNQGQPPMPTQQIGAGYSIVAAVPLYAIKANGTAAQQGDGVVVFDPATGPVSLVLHFKTQGTGTDWSIAPVPPIGSYMAYLLQAVQDYFEQHVDEIDYALAGLNPAPAAGDDAVTPVAFTFATHTTSDGTSMLALFIAAGQSGIGKPTPVIETPLIAGTESATLIFSRPFILTGFLQPGLQGGTVSSAPDGSFSAQMNTQATIQAVNIFQPGNAGSSISIVADAKTLDMSSYPYTLAFGGSSLTIVNDIVEQQPYEVETYIPGPGGSSQSYTATGTAQVGKSFTYADCAPLSQTELKLTATIGQSDYAVSVDPGRGGGGCGDDVNTQIKTAIQQGLSGVLPTIEFDFSPLNFFAATNLLLPGQSVITFDTTAGLSVPNEFLIAGNVAAPPSVSSRSSRRGDRPFGATRARRARRRPS